MVLTLLTSATPLYGSQAFATKCNLILFSETMFSFYVAQAGLECFENCLLYSPHVGLYNLWLRIWKQEYYYFSDCIFAVLFNIMLKPLCV